MKTLSIVILPLLKPTATVGPYLVNNKRLIRLCLNTTMQLQWMNNILMDTNSEVLCI